MITPPVYRGRARNPGSRDSGLRLLNSVSDFFPISAGFGSMLAQWLGLSAQEQRIAVAVGMGAGIGAIFRAPLGGALMGAEILYIHDLEVEALIPSLIASIVGYTVLWWHLRLRPHLRRSGLRQLHPSCAADVLRSAGPNLLPRRSRL